MGEPPEEQILGSIEELERFFADLCWTNQSFVYGGVQIEAIVPSRRSPLLAFLLNLFLYALARGAQQTRGDGVHLRLTLPVPVVADLRLESRDKPLSDEADPLARHFYWSATSDELVRRYLESSMANTLVQLSARYKIVMTDETIRIGPLARTPAEDAEAVDKLVRALPRPSSSDFAGDRPDEPVAMERESAVLLGSTTSRTQADLWRTLAENAGLPCWSEGYESSPPWGAASPPREIRLFVPHQQLEAARALVKRAEEANGMLLCHQCGETARDRADRCLSCGASLKSGADES